MGAPAVLGSTVEEGLRLGLVVTAFWLGFRHGIDWDHIAAITDITSSQEERRRALLYGTLYALGHAVVVFLIGVAAIAFGENLPPSVDEVMTRVVGVTLLILGIYVVVSLIRHGRDFRMRSRWMLIFSGVRRGVRWLRSRARDSGVPARASGGGAARPGGHGGVAVAVAGGDGDDLLPSRWHHGHHGKLGHHHHRVPEPDDQFMRYGRGTSFVVGMIHGIGGETPTQVVLFTAASGTRGVGSGVIVLAVFLFGLFASNSAITVGSALGYTGASRNFALYATVGVLTAGFSLVIGTIFVLGKTTMLPALFGG